MIQGDMYGKDGEKQSSVNYRPSDGAQNIFGPWVSAEFNNRSRVLVPTNFFAFAPTAFMTYYWAIVKNNIDWYLGNVPGIHDQGIFSSHTAGKVCKMAAQLTMAGSYRFEGKERAMTFLSAFNKKRTIEEKLRAELPLLNAIGFALGKVDIRADNHLDVSFVAGNKYYVQVDDDGEVLAMYAMIKNLTADVVSDDDKQEGFYLVEERYYKKVCGKAVPIQRYRIYRGPILATAPTEVKQQGTKGLEASSLSVSARRQLDRSIGLKSLNKEFVLPFDNLGVRVLLNAYTATGMEQYKQFADSTINDIHNALYDLDWTKTLKNEHKYLAQDFVAMPEASIPPEKFGGSSDRAVAIAKAYIDSDLEGYNKRLVKVQRNGDPTKQVPYAYQPVLKIGDYNADIDHIYAEIASGAQFSPATLSNYLKGDAVKTATQVRVDEGATQTTVSDKRQLIADGMNKLFDVVLKYYGIAEKAVMVFNTSGVADKQGELEMLKMKQDNGWISKEQAILEANPQLSKKEALVMSEKIKDEQSYGTSFMSELNFNG